MMMDPAVVLALAHIASQLSGYSLPNHPPPNVIELTTQEMHETACGSGGDPGCMDDIGLYRDGDLIWVDSEYTNSAAGRVSENSIVIHELVHWLQKEHAWGDGGGCAHAQARENEAYRVEGRYIREYEHKSTSVTAPEMCYHLKTMDITIFGGPQQ